MRYIPSFKEALLALDIQINQGVILEIITENKSIDVIRTTSTRGSHKHFDLCNGGLFYY
jgi:hypothetical protein